MNSVSSVTYDMDDVLLAAKELLSCLDGFVLQKNTIGILFADVETNIAALVKEIKKSVSFDIIGVTTQAVLDNKLGMNEFASGLLVMTADDVRFDVFVSGAVRENNIETEIEKMCNAAKNSAAKDAKFVIMAVPIVSTVILDDYPDMFSKFLGDVPVFGGGAGAHAENNTAYTIQNENIYSDKFVAVFVSGNVDPVFSIGSKVTEDLENYKTVTKADKNIVYEVEGMTFVEYAKFLGMEVFHDDETNVDVLIAGLTLNVIMPGTKGAPPVYKAVLAVNLNDGSCTIDGKAPVGSSICVSIYNEKRIEASAHTCVTDIMQKIARKESGGSAYSVLLCGSCEGRYKFMYPTKDVEGDIIKAGIDERLTVMGYYTGGEICPINFFQNGTGERIINRAHNTTLTFCAF